MKIGFNLMLAGTVVVGLGIGAALGAYQSSSKSPAALAAAPINGGSGAASGLSGGGPTSQAAGVRPTMGPVEKVGDNEFTVTVSDSSYPVTVRTNEQTQIRKQVAGAPTDIQKGQRITVRGQAAEDGTLSAASVQIGAEGVGGQQAQRGQSLQSGSGMASQFGRGGASQNGGNGTPENSRAGASPGGRNGASQNGAEVAVGTVQEVADNVVTITPGGSQGGSQGQNRSSVKVTLSDQTVILKSDSGSFKDITEGAYVAVNGPRGADGVVVATGIQILPQEASHMTRGQ
ncbi:MAG: DUF5666 domain-containing protein [Chloroflexi bacterium]|nr:DUF5666 domain-containing protein [Chloroflexota bacterium]